VSLFDTCDANVPDPEKDERHPGSSLLAIDLSGNGLKDLLIGDINYPGLIQLTNSGTTSGAVMTAFTDHFPPNTQAIDITMFPAAYFHDADNDGLKDLIVAPNNPNTSENFNNIWLYKNQGSNDIPEFEFIKSNFLFDEMIDVGERSYPVFFDVNSDGLMDIIVGNFGYFQEAGSYTSQLMLLRNTGTISDPAFEIISDDYGDLAQFGFNGIYSSFGDLDGDGDYDIFSKPYAYRAPGIDIWLQNGTGPLISTIQGTNFNSPIGLQMYSLRYELKNDVPGTIEKVADWKPISISCCATVFCASTRRANM